MNMKPSKPSDASSGKVFDRIAAILDGARDRVLRSVNHETVTAYWLIGREIVHALQEGKERASYGDALIDELSTRLTAQYGSGFSRANLKNFRQFYLAYPNRIGYPAGSLLEQAQLAPSIGDPLGSESAQGFHPSLSWSHYRALMRVDSSAARQFYEEEAVRANWSRRDLERQIGSLFYQRLMASSEEELKQELERERILIENQREQQA